jgi:bifunctional ADP-heptose synthase (sugar kinase/adenylyltransferase)
MVVIEKGNKYTHIPVFNKSKVFDVTGAGDTVTATYTLALAIGADPVYAAIIGNIAAGIVIKQFGCATTTIDEILESAPKKIELEY